ncbi:MAG: hypothetical protein K0R72_774 [Clostridia bacterium]|jgi:hypothetical protein|nr:hypothetical protein [Clostridia bacterium]
MKGKIYIILNNKITNSKKIKNLNIKLVIKDNHMYKYLFLNLTEFIYMYKLIKYMNSTNHTYIVS